MSGDRKMWNLSAQEWGKDNMSRLEGFLLKWKYVYAAKVQTWRICAFAEFLEGAKYAALQRTLADVIKRQLDCTVQWICFYGNLLYSALDAHESPVSHYKTMINNFSAEQMCRASVM